MEERIKSEVARPGILADPGSSLAIAEPPRSWGGDSDELENRSAALGVVVLGALVVCLLLVGLALASEGAPGGHEGISPAKITDFTWRTVNFLVFAGLLIYILTKKFPVKNFFVARSQGIAKSLEDLEKQKGGGDCGP